MDTALFIRARRKELNMTLEELGKRVGVAKSTIKNWEDGNVDNMKRSNIEALSKALNVTPIELMCFDNDDEKQAERAYVPFIPFLKNEDEIFDENNIEDFRVILKHNLPEGKVFFTNVTDNSLSPFLCIEDMIMVRIQKEFKNNDVLVFNENGRLTARKVKVYDNITLLHSLDVDDPPLQLNDNIKIVGVAIEVFRYLQSYFDE